MSDSSSLSSSSPDSSLSDLWRFFSGISTCWTTKGLEERLWMFAAVTASRGLFSSTSLMIGQEGASSEPCCCRCWVHASFPRKYLVGRIHHRHTLVHHSRRHTPPHCSTAIPRKHCSTGFLALAGVCHSSITLEKELLLVRRSRFGGGCSNFKFNKLDHRSAAMGSFLASIPGSE